ncbi:hypothetical protein PIB30_056707 [Stylosanthes scabra]|uniref:Zinc finger GRF-type domain-containing protein n=1 Tax=Stylosanthes scabra TaxID=79078 RepID=A0ABU6TJ82_9FABA|nr:hypothetical protein [Stylosanthes scabra]
MSSSRYSSRSTASTQRRMTLVCYHGDPPVLRVSGTKENSGWRFWGCSHYEDLAGRVRSGSGRRERKERKDRNKPKRRLLEPMRTHPMEPCVRIQAWAARPITDLSTYAYAYEASMRTHRSIPASINRGAFHHFKRAHFHI